MQATLTGVKEIDSAIRKLSSKQGDKIAKAAISGGLAELARSIKREAPKGPTGNLKKSIGKRFEKPKGKQAISAKAGINVGKQKRTAEFINGRPRAPHVHLVALGTKPRIRKHIGGKFGYLANPTRRQLSTGVMPANPFVKFAANKAATRVKNMMRERARRALVKQAKLAASKKG